MPLFPIASNARVVLCVVSVSFAFAATFGCSSTAAPATKKTFRIGLEAPLSGSQSEVGTGMLRGAQLAAQELNASGGVLGRSVEIVSIDDKADPDAGVVAANAAVSSGLDAVVGPYNSGVGLKTLPIYLAAGLIPLRLTSSDQTAGLGYTLQPMTAQIAPVATTALTTWLKASSVALIVDSTTEYNKAAADAVTALLGKANVAVVVTESIAPGAANYDAVVTKVLAAKPSVVYVVAYYPEAGLVA